MSVGNCALWVIVKAIVWILDINIARPRFVFVSRYLTLYSCYVIDSLSFDS